MLVEFFQSVENVIFYFYSLIESKPLHTYWPFGAKILPNIGSHHGGVSSVSNYKSYKPSHDTCGVRTRVSVAHVSVNSFKTEIPSALIENPKITSIKIFIFFCNLSS